MSIEPKRMGHTHRDAGFPVGLTIRGREHTEESSALLVQEVREQVLDLHRLVDVDAERNGRLVAVARHHGHGVVGEVAVEHVPVRLRVVDRAVLVQLSQTFADPGVIPLVTPKK